MANFKFIKTFIDDVYIIENKVFNDKRGYFMESYNLREFVQNELSKKFVQDNESKSRKGVLRGLHFQKKYPQGKLIRVIEGEVFDVAVDIRAKSKTLGQWIGVYLSEENKRQLYIPEGFAHGFLVVSDTAKFIYKCTEMYHPEDECGIIWNDADVNIHWPINRVEEIILSEKDKKWKGLNTVINNYKEEI
ncbi:dTDP-4-dehydrorhamnose 3,5-epimerase [Clostridium tetanomorphum]|uniref:dTDP-4-dehydrorhamnose 3,5-epimerase n=1 Tax=Clostridium tetanomorphum TaxID=1553 RepID=A0A923IYI2_CLOTT|nr:dTDP-4-dehydrorhamnose 3,5-epimerase [Clostridium tetanomorphum]KAJ51377.1 dTDP-4-dehydrorhamnose 3,5-epimerase [Clostridium tetanomorphum DSM 665]MBC2396416.1 dTDP-4-dehydrorhamnose 3,5-epimerase [Clostridium tetanomorphum]MBP1863354.1 dTDP-4-dehydrorhamnose 3,5-epimerase [Clostridium tetanomorphum]NRS83451.1 dTDP-4-dehydrorhamnose 3,5-epimerase [Clostridium tetanomorphum]NRZ96651.1 dTDP-4-dehydrorhamnose 3,5-epimerase [Clostridium tetanomorphum]